MHEFSLAREVHDRLLGLAERHKADKILKAEVCVGSNAGIIVNSFSCGFHALIEQNESTRGMDVVITHDSSNDLLLKCVELEEKAPSATDHSMSSSQQ